MIYIYKDTARENVYFLSRIELGEVIVSFEEVENYQEAALGFLSEKGLDDSFLLEDRTNEDNSGS